MSATRAERNTIVVERKVSSPAACYHCGTECANDNSSVGDKVFCCDGCKLVFEILNENGLCDYYKLQSHPGLGQIKASRNDKFSYLDDPAISRPLYRFNDGKNSIVTFYIPSVHCTSCLWLLEHIYRIHSGITESRLNFGAKEVTIHFRNDRLTIRQLVELLATIGYEPYISLENDSEKSAKAVNKQLLYKLGIAGFCFGNIMMLSFPEYLAIGADIEARYAQLFRYLALFLSLPVVFYSATEFYVSAWKGLKQRTLNIDAPIVLALAITFIRSVYEIATDTGSGFLDSMSGIVFFMLVGRVVQQRTYRSLSFHRDYKAYFPLAVNVIEKGNVVSTKLKDLKEKDTVQLFNNDIIPADGVVVEGEALIDYSFVSGESDPVLVKKGGAVYAGGRQVGQQVLVTITKAVSESYLTSLWSHYSFRNNKTEQNASNSFIHTLSRYFTYVLLALAGITAVYWWANDPSKILPSVSAMLIVACPCALLLAATYTNGNLLRIFSNNGLFLRDATVIEQLGKIQHIVFDKTGTLTHGVNKVEWIGTPPGKQDLEKIYAVAVSSKHPVCLSLAAMPGSKNSYKPEGWQEVPGAGVRATVAGNIIAIGSAGFVGLDIIQWQQASAYIRINDRFFRLRLVPDLRDPVPEVINRLDKNYSLSLLSGDNDSQKAELTKLFGEGKSLIFRQKPIEKLRYIEGLQSSGVRVMMVGDGLNDAGALQQSNVGITLTDDINNFTPSCDAILDAARFDRFPAIMRLAQLGKKIITLSFIISIIYNMAGLYISMTGNMSPMIAAILMPLSTVSIVLITTGLGSLVARMLGLSLRSS